MYEALTEPLTFIEFRIFKVMLKLKKAVLQHILGIDLFNAKEVENHVVGEMKCRVDWIWFTTDQLLAHRWAHFFINHENDNTTLIEASATSAATHLNVLARGEPPKVGAVKLSRIGKDYRSRWHVETHGKGFSSKESFD